MPISVYRRLFRYTVFAAFMLLSKQSFAVIDFEPCYVTGSAGNGNLQAQCATWTRPLDPTRPDGPTVDLFVTKLASTALQPAADAFTIINGGPGASSVQMMVDLAPVLQAFTRERDVVVIDQRGTGDSAPLICQALTDSTEVLDAQQTIALTQDCIDKLPYDPRFFSTAIAVEDLEALRIALNYEQLSVYGVSYGTRVAMQYMRTYPQSLRSVVIDGVVPPTKVLGENVALNSQQTLDGLFERCRRHPSCGEQFPDLAADFERLREQLRSDPVAMNIQHPVTGVNTDIEVGYGHLAVWIRLALYAPATSALIPLIIDEAANAENFLPIAASALRMLHQLNDSMNYGMHNAVVCTEDAPFFDDTTVDFQQLEKTYLGREMYDTLKAMCSTWPAGVIGTDMKKPLVSSVPTLVLSGEFDPITPPEYGDAVMPGLSQAKHIVAPGQGHGTIAQGCIPRLILEFVESADPGEIDASCVEHLDAFPFFVDLMGPRP